MKISIFILILTTVVFANAYQACVQLFPSHAAAEIYQARQLQALVQLKQRVLDTGHYAPETVESIFTFFRDRGGKENQSFSTRRLEMQAEWEMKISEMKKLGYPYLKTLELLIQGQPLFEPTLSDDELNGFDHVFLLGRTLKVADRLFQSHQAVFLPFKNVSEKPNEYLFNEEELGLMFMVGILPIEFPVINRFVDGVNMSPTRFVEHDLNHFAGLSGLYRFIESFTYLSRESGVDKFISNLFKIQNPETRVKCFKFLHWSIHENRVSFDYLRKNNFKLPDLQFGNKRSQLGLTPEELKVLQNFLRQNFIIGFQPN